MDSKSFTLDFLGSSYDCHYIKDPTDAEKALQFLMRKDVCFAIDTETAALPAYKHIKEAALSPHLSQIRLLQVFDGVNVVVFDLNAFSSTQKEMFLPFLNSKQFVAHYAQFDLQRFIQMGVKDMNLHCTHIMATLLHHAIYWQDHVDSSLDGLAESLLKIKVNKSNQASDWSANELIFEQIEYACRDVLALYFIADILKQGIVKYNLHRIYKLEKQALQAIAKMQLNGFKLDREKHIKLIPAWVKDLLSAKDEVIRITGIKKLTGPQLADWLEKNLAPSLLAIWPRTEPTKVHPEGMLSTSADTFSRFDYLPVVEPFSIYQKKATLCSTFGNTLVSQINPHSGRLHSNFRQIGAKTGRLSSSAPNCQNFPRLAEFRDNFVADEGKIFITADYSQIELRIAAEVSQDERMLKAYRDNIDLHRMTAASVLGKPMEMVSDVERQIGKALGLGLLYGLGAAKFSNYVKKGYGKDGINVTQEQSFAFIEAYRETYPDYRQWQIDQAERCRESLLAVTPLGKRRKLHKDFYYGAGLNMPIQGAAAEVIKSSLVHINKAFPSESLVNCIHDENILELPRGSEDNYDEVMDYIDTLEKCMVKGFLDVFPNGVTTSLVEATFGPSWGFCKSKAAKKIVDKIKESRKVVSLPEQEPLNMVA